MLGPPPRCSLALPFNTHPSPRPENRWGVVASFPGPVPCLAFQTLWPFLLSNNSNSFLMSVLRPRTWEMVLPLPMLT